MATMRQLWMLYIVRHAALISLTHCSINNALWAAYVRIVHTDAIQHLR